MRKLSLVLLAIPLLSTKCNKKNDCADAICTQMFAAVTVTVTDKDGNNIDLQDYYTINTTTGDTLRHNNSTWPEGAYTVLDDGYVSKMYNKTLQFRFVGIKDNAVIADENYTISADCCHISKKSGKETIVTE